MSAPTRAQLRALRAEAGEAGDLEQVRLCDRALDGDAKALKKCAAALADAEAQAEPPKRGRGRPSLGLDVEMTARITSAQADELDAIVADGHARGRAEAMRWLIDQSARARA